MKIETKFDINNLVVSKYQRNQITQKSKNDLLLCFEVIDIKTGTCMAGTQVFYVCRSIHGMTDTNYIEGKRVTTYTDFTAGSNSKGEYITFREDEIIEAPKEVIDLVLGNS
jgi:hypothetical protein